MDKIIVTINNYMDKKILIIIVSECIIKHKL